jgi:hypothetical protein
MRRAQPFEKALLCLATFLCAGGSLSFRHALATPPDRAVGTRGTGLISDRRQIPPDPLGGLPEEEPDRRPRGRDKGKNGQGAGGKATCRLEARPESDREVGDLRAAVAVMQRGPRTAPCTLAQMANPLRVRLSIDGEGRITAVERLSGDEKLGTDLAGSLVGQVSLSKVTLATTGVAQIHLHRAAR